MIVRLVQRVSPDNWSKDAFTPLSLGKISCSARNDKKRLLENQKIDSLTL